MSLSGFLKDLDETFAFQVEKGVKQVPLNSDEVEVLLNQNSLLCH